jgi:hypothetical protein
LQRYKSGVLRFTAFIVWRLSRFSEEYGKSAAGKATNKIVFSCPVKANKAANGMKSNLPRGPAGKVGRV